MEKQELDSKIAEVTQVVHRYCLSRTSNVEDAEDLAQEILLELYKSATNLRDEKAFYGFMWSIAGNVFKQWYKKKAKLGEHFSLAEELAGEDGRADYGLAHVPGGAITENGEFVSGVTFNSPVEEEVLSALEPDSDIRLLRRELGLLAEKYREATVLYYLENKSCQEMAEILSVSESMVKYLLFKSRQIVKDGMNMERTYGVQSYNPKKMNLAFWGGRNNYKGVADDMISQNILFACYNDKLNGEQISLEIGVALPYLEEHLQRLVEYELLKMDGNRYYTNIVIFTKEFVREVDQKTVDIKKHIAEIVEETLAAKEQEIRTIGFAGNDMDKNTYRWQMTCLLLRMAVVEKIQNELKLEYPTDKFGEKCFIWGEERFRKEATDSKGLGYGMCSLDNDRGDEFFFMDVKVNGKFVHHYFFDKLIWRNIFGSIAAGETDAFSENDKVLIAEMVKLGFVKNRDGVLSVKAPVYAQEQYDKLYEILDEAANQIKGEVESMLSEISKILKNHAPAHLKKTAAQMGFIRLMEVGISAPLAILYDEKFMTAVSEGDLLPTTYVVLNR